MSKTIIKCPGCGKPLFSCCEKGSFLYGYGIGCTNLSCEIDAFIIGHGLTEKSAEKSAMKKWNRWSKARWKRVDYNGMQL